MTNEKDKREAMDADCIEAFDHLYAYLNGEIEDKQTLERVEHHLGHCKSCYSRAQMERELNDRIKQSGQDKSPESLKRRLDDLMEDL